MKKMITILTILFFLMATVSCSVKRMRVVQIDTMKEKKINKVSILGLSTMANKWVEFSRRDPGRVEGNKITGSIFEGGKLQKVVIPRSQVRLIRVTMSSDKPVAGNILKAVGLVFFGLFVMLIANPPDF